MATKNTKKPATIIAKAKSVLKKTNPKSSVKPVAKKAPVPKTASKAKSVPAPKTAVNLAKRSHELISDSRLVSNKANKLKTSAAKKLIIVAKKKQFVKPAKKVAPVAKKITPGAKKPVAKAIPSIKSQPYGKVAKPKVKQPVVPIAKTAVKPVNKKQPAPAMQYIQPQITQEKRMKPEPEKNGKKATIETLSKVRYNDKDLSEFREIIYKKLAEARRDYNLLQATMSHTDDHGTDDTSPTFKLMEDGTDVITREETSQLAARQQKFIQHLEEALVRIENKSYGICRTTGKLIPKDRLRVVPHATLSIDAKMQQ